MNYKTNNLDKYDFSTQVGFNAILIRLRYEEYKKYFKGKNCLEFGCADGEGTKLLLQYFTRVVGVDGSDKLINKIRQEINDKRAEFIKSFFEEFKTSEKFDFILLGHVLEHVHNPITVLKVAKACLKRNGVMLIDVPNARSIHRQIGVLMGLIKSEYTLNEADFSIGHQRVYDLKKLRKDVEKAGLKVYKEGGLFLKPFSNQQMQEFLNVKGIKAFNELGKRYPDLAAEIYMLCRN
jgi:2-polyprenyl-3-methyl-5-hydroxy-6-metoxy-1,4-benzoquinol methylase